MKQKRFGFHLIYGIMMLFFLFVIIFVAAKPKPQSLADTEYEKTAPFTEGWHTADGTELDEKSLRKINKISENKEISIFNTLPTDKEAAKSLFSERKTSFTASISTGNRYTRPNSARAFSTRTQPERAGTALISSPNSSARK